MDPYVGEIRMFGGGFAPAGWMSCDGQELAISEYETLFNLIGTTYGGDGQATFKLPDLRGRLPVHMVSASGTNNLAASGGVEQVTLTLQQTPAHTHAVQASSDPADATSPAGNLPATTLNTVLYRSAPSQALAVSAIATAGGSQPHSNLQPFVCITFIICLYGIFPSPNVVQEAT